MQIIANDEPASVTLVFFRVASGWKAVEPYLWPFALEEKRREAKTKKPHFSPSPRQFVPKPVLSFGSLWNHLHFSAFIKVIAAFLNQPKVWLINMYFAHFQLGVAIKKKTKKNKSCSHFSLKCNFVSASELRIPPRDLKSSRNVHSGKPQSRLLRIKGQKN